MHSSRLSRRCAKSPIHQSGKISIFTFQNKNWMKTIACLTCVMIILLVSCTSDQSASDYSGWEKAHGNGDGNHYSSLTQIDTSNVQQLKIAWTFHTGDADTTAHSQIQCNPIIVNGTMYCTSPLLKLFAIDAATGKQKWVFSPIDSLPGNMK